MPQRGDLIVVSLPGDSGKPRPAVVMQDDTFAATATLFVLPISSNLLDVADIRVRITPNATNGLRETSDVMIERGYTIARAKAGSAFGALTRDQMDRVGVNLSIFLGLA